MRPVPVAQPRNVVAAGGAAREARRVEGVEFWVNGTLKCTDTTAPYTCAWTVPRRVGRSYTLKARASDAAGNRGVSTRVTVTSQ